MRIIATGIEVTYKKHPGIVLQGNVPDMWNQSGGGSIAIQFHPNRPGCRKRDILTLDGEDTELINIRD